MSWIKKTFLILAVNLFGIFVVIVLLELIFGGWLKNDPWIKVNRLNVIRDQKITYDVAKIYGADSSSVIYTRDKYGLRGGCSDNKKINFVSIGGSTTDQRYIPDGETWQDIFQSKLREFDLVSNACVANAGVDGHSTHGHLRSFDLWFPLIPDFKPKYFLFYIGVNDAPIRLEPIFSFDSRFDGNSYLQKFHAYKKDYSAIYRLITIVKSQAMTDKVAYAGHKVNVPRDVDYVSTKVTPGFYNLSEKNTELFSDRLKNLLVKVNGLKGVPVCVSQPTILYKNIGGQVKGVRDAFIYDGTTFNGLDYRHSILSINKVMSEICPQYGGIYINLEDKTFDAADYYDAVHMTPSGVKKVGEYLFDGFRKANFIKTVN